MDTPIVIVSFMLLFSCHEERALDDKPVVKSISEDAEPKSVFQSQMSTKLIAVKSLEPVELQEEKPVKVVQAGVTRLGQVL